MVSVNGYRRHLGSCRKLLYQEIVFPSGECRIHHVREIAAKQHKVRMEAIANMHDTFHLFAAEQRINVEVTKKYCRKFTLRRNSHLKFTDLEVLVVADANRQEHNRHHDRNKKQKSRHRNDKATVNRFLHHGTANTASNPPKNIKEKSFAQPDRKERHAKRGDIICSKLQTDQENHDRDSSDNASLDSWRHVPHVHEQEQHAENEYKQKNHISLACTSERTSR